MMVDSREAILKGSKAAHTLHLDLGVREPFERAERQSHRRVRCSCQPGRDPNVSEARQVVGAYLPAKEPGVLITTQRTLPIQRFTCAHELGHLYMRHDPSLDDERILRRSPFSTTSKVSPQEREADAFASMFLAPAWLLALIVERQQWPAKLLGDPVIAYQLSLRLGTSYAATCYVLGTSQGDQPDTARATAFDSSQRP